MDGWKTILVSFCGPAQPGRCELLVSGRAHHEKTKSSDFAAHKRSFAASLNIVYLHRPWLSPPSAPIFLPWRGRGPCVYSKRQPRCRAMLQHWTHVVSRLAMEPSNHLAKNWDLKRMFWSQHLMEQSVCCFLFRKMQATNSLPTDTVALHNFFKVTFSSSTFSKLFTPSFRGNEKLQIFGGTHEVLFRKSTWHISLPAGTDMSRWFSGFAFWDVGHCWWFRNPAFTSWGW